MKATKGNKTYTITEQDKKRYQDAGYDIQDDTGKTIAYGRGKTIPYEEYVALEAKYNALLAERSGENKGTDVLDSMTVEELTAYAAENKINLGRATSRDGILEKIRASQKQGE